MKRATVLGFVVWMAAVAAFATTATADLVVIEKSKHTLSLYRHGHLLKSYKVALGPHPEGRKRQAGDGRTPEGRYIIDFRKSDSHYHRSLHVSYPNDRDRLDARRRGVSPGGDIFIHGLPNGMGAIGKAHRLRDWTLGCVAVTNEEIEEIWELVPNRTVVDIRP